MFATVLALAMVGGWGGGSPMQFASPGQCSGGYCPAPTAYRAYRVGTQIDGRGTLAYDGPAQPQREYRWSPIEHDGLVFQVWGYLEPSGKFRWQQSLKENRENWAKAIEASQAKAEPKPVAVTKPETDINQTGIDRSKFLPRSNIYTAPSNEAKRFVGELNSVEAEPNKIHVTVIGEEADCAPVIRDLNDPSGPFAYMRGQLLVQDYRPKEWQVDPGLGFPIHGKPAIVVQSAKGPLDPVGGKVIYRANDYSMGPKGLAEAIRKVNPNYKPDQDPGPATGKTDDGPMAFLIANPIFPVSAVAFVLILLISPKRKDG